MNDAIASLCQNHRLLSLVTRQFVLDCSGSKRMSRVNTSRPVDTFILTDAHIVVYEVGGYKERRLG